MLKKTWVKVILVLLLVWLSTSLYFYTQHMVTVRTYNVEKQLVFPEGTINLKQIRLENFERKTDFIYRNYGVIAAKFLPDDLKLPFLNLCLFYTRPYKYYEKGFAAIKLRGNIVLNPSNDAERIKENIVNKYDIEIINQVGVHFSGSKAFSQSDDSNVIRFEITGRYFEKDSPHNKILKIAVKDKETGEFRFLTVEPVWEKNTYNFFKRAPKQ
ncbi:MAG: hypothetical protein PWR06_2745 [Thermoanaerobacteraceae bacterium]|nr:hypothetical protein [Thermoanaerobacteraceae bacterium]MDN5301336.1 hypothetical protein [Thermoanaerobacteraceae bacterium]MDN5312755.1 hypothetical protein [Thermoanaerobacteraceae bacterium]